MTLDESGQVERFPRVEHFPPLRLLDPGKAPSALRAVDIHLGTLAASVQL